MKTYTNASLLKEYINHFNIPKKYLCSNSEENGPIQPENGDGLSTIGEYYIMSLSLVPKKDADKTFEKILAAHEKINKDEYDEIFVSLHEIPWDKENDLIFIVCDNDYVVENLQKLVKSKNKLPYSDEFNIYPEGFFDNDGGLVSMNFDLTLATLRCQNFYTEQFPAGKYLSGEIVCFTGFRDEKLESLIVYLGGKISKTVNKNTTILLAADPDSSSSKVEEAEDLDVPVLSMFEFITKKLKPNSIKEESWS